MKLLTEHFENHFCYRRVNLELSMTKERHFQTFKDNAQFDFHIGAEDAGGKYLVGMIVLAILLVILCVILAYFIYRIRRLKLPKENSENKSKERNNSKDIYENPEKVKDDGNYEQVENEQSTYTALNRSRKDENDDHFYAHLNEVHKDYVNQQETGI